MIFLLYPSEEILEARDYYLISMQRDFINDNHDTAKRENMPLQPPLAPDCQNPAGENFKIQFFSGILLDLGISR